MSRKHHRHPGKAKASSEIEDQRAPQRHGSDDDRFDPDNAKVVSRIERPKLDDDDVLEYRDDRDRMRRDGATADDDEAEVADEDILEAIDVDEYRRG